MPLFTLDMKAIVMKGRPTHHVIESINRQTGSRKVMCNRSLFTTVLFAGHYRREA